jgi:membrane-associated PAP2 superfamily phosphatase
MMGYARISQGAHFLSDVLWSLGIVYLTGLALFYLMARQREETVDGEERNAVAVP